jgi:hypothetical protein
MFFQCTIQNVTFRNNVRFSFHFFDGADSWNTPVPSNPLFQTELFNNQSSCLPEKNTDCNSATMQGISKEKKSYLLLMTTFTGIISLSVGIMLQLRMIIDREIFILTKGITILP